MNNPTTFTDFGVEAVLADALASQGIVTPFPIQELTLPMALKGADLIGQARTGTGKTLAFGLPLIQKIDPGLQKTQALVVVPTRELCLQVADDLTIGRQLGISSIAIYGGVGYDEQIEALRSGVHVVIGTPGRTLDHLGRGNLDLSNVHIVVLDEADEMLDMGFLPDVERLLTTIPEERQTLLFSATMPAAIVKLARRFMSQPTFMRAEAEERETAPTVDQHFFLVHRMDKPRVLARILQGEDRGGAFVFTRTKNMADRLVRELEDLRVSAIAVHGDLRQTTRERNLDRFRAGTADVLVATEVAARGLDVENVTHVINYDCPEDEKMYLHRIGRTARAGSSGMAITFAEFNEIDRLNVIRKAVGAEGEITEVFSTSGLLTERFDLPEATPWDHMARSNGAAGSSRSKERSHDSARRPSSSKGRNQSRRDSEGSRPASRDRGRPSAKSRQQDARPSRSDDSASRDRATSRERASASRESASSSRESASSSSERVRTRTRTRSRPSDTAPRTDTAPQEVTTSRDATSGSDTPSARKRGSDRSESPARPRSSGRDRAADGRKDGAKAKAKARNSRGGTAKASDAPKAQTNGQDRTTRRGEAARGDGTPRPRRRVQVDHLP